MAPAGGRCSCRPLPHAQIRRPLVMSAALAIREHRLVPWQRDRFPEPIEADEVLAHVGPPPELLQEHRHAGRLALPDETANPRHVTRSRLLAALAADDHPIETRRE